MLTVRTVKFGHSARTVGVDSARTVGVDGMEVAVGTVDGTGRFGR